MYTLDSTTRIFSLYLQRIGGNGIGSLNIFINPLQIRDGLGSAVVYGDGNGNVINIEMAPADTIAIPYFFYRGGTAADYLDGTGSAKSFPVIPTVPSYESSTANILMDSTVSVGTTNTIARGNHRHPTDTSREPAFSKNTAFNKNFETATSNIKMNGVVSVGTSSNVPRADHVHPIDTSRQAALVSSSSVISAPPSPQVMIFPF